jgi:hypothetical protein
VDQALTIFIGSPSDVPDERKIVREVAQDLDIRVEAAENGERLLRLLFMSLAEQGGSHDWCSSQDAFG